jgi:membrane associated rhomboid family serine protease/Flp pilus assembly protein TadD
MLLKVVWLTIAANFPPRKKEPGLANCKECGAPLPSMTFGDVSDYCKSCQPNQPPVPKNTLEEALAPVAMPISRWATATNALITVNVLVFVAMLASGADFLAPSVDQLIRWGADYGPDTLGGQYWRLISSAFVHIGFIHLLFNMFCLWKLGRLAERLVGPQAILGIYLATGTGAAIFSLSWNPMRVSAGASGAVFGIAGVLVTTLYYGKLDLPKENRHKLLAYVVKFSLLNLLYGLRGHVDNMAHVGGLVVGLVLGLFLARSFSLEMSERPAQRRAVILAGALGVLLLFLPVMKAKGYVLALKRGQQALEKQDFGGATEAFKKYVAASPDDAYGHALLGFCYHSTKRYDEAAEEYKKGLALQPDYPFIEVNLAEVYVYQNKSAEAVPLFQHAIDRIDPDAEAYYFYGRALKDASSFPEAEQALKKSISLNDKDADAHRLLADVLRVEGKVAAALQEEKRARDLTTQGIKKDAKLSSDR